MSEAIAEKPAARRRSWDIGRYTLLITLVAIVVVTAIGNPRFFTINNLFNILLQISVLGILAAGQTMLIVSAGLDLSVGAALSVAGVVAALTIVSTGSIALGIAAGLATGALIGFVNGLLVATNRATPFIVTLGTMTLLQGAAIVISGGSPINGMGALFDVFGLGDLFGVPNPVYALAATLVVVFFVLRRTVLGRSAFAIGGNEEAARLSGIPVRSRKIGLYTLNGLIVGVGAVVLTGILDSALPNMGNGYELRTIAAVVIGGTPLFGGRGTVVGTFGGVLLLGLVSNSMNLLGVGANYQNVVLGLIITAAVLLQKRG
ncbi:ABC transporter permease [Propylenella binzhouense]|uniref:ABC transporter permease n=1 Tax=Propylenella binzhouense TaxID=2555902 RepID=A0A964T2F8_9HYPH|nr:ABC transporter permease [Propylenella binzhouense]MYZ47243.1 ABC transporter permease [Propylenella binzhouense]